MVDYAALAGLIAFAWLPVPGFRTLGTEWPAWLRGRLPFLPFLALWHALHAHDVWVLYGGGEDDVRAVFLSWCLLKVWGANLFRNSPTVWSHLLTSVGLFFAAYLQISIARVGRSSPAIAGLVTGSIGAASLYLVLEFLDAARHPYAKRRRV